MRKTVLKKHEIQRKTVLDQAAKMFAEKGYSGSSLGDVARELGISRPALYYYFSSKQEILSSLIEEISVTSMKTVRGIVAQPMEVVDKLRELTYQQLLFVMRNKLSYMVVVKTEEELVDESHRINLEAKKAVLTCFRQVIAEGVSTGALRPVDPSVAALGIIGMCSWCAWWFQPNGRMSDEVIARDLADMAIRSLLPDASAAQNKAEIISIINALGDVSSRLEGMSDDL